MELTCRYCFIGPSDDRRPLIRPCQCLDGYCHLACLEKWINVRPKTRAVHRCEICQQPYSNIIIVKATRACVRRGAWWCSNLLAYLVLFAVLYWGCHVHTAGVILVTCIFVVYLVISKQILSMPGRCLSQNQPPDDIYRVWKSCSNKNSDGKVIPLGTANCT